MITLKHIKVAYGDHVVVNEVSATIATGCITALMGPNGCGKTTLLRCMGGLLAPTAGEVLLEGRPVGEYRAKAFAQKVAFVRQHPQANFDFTAFEMVLMGRNPYQHRLQGEGEADYAIVERCMQQTETWHLRHAHTSQMSGGELQRIMIARALAQDTPVLLMDEPVSSLDISHQIETMHLLRSLGKTVVIVLHDLNLALHFCDHLILLHQGGVHYHGSIDEGLSGENIATVYGVSTHREEGHIVFEY